MLIDLSIRDVVLIDRLSLSFDGGLGALTGETGAGKSILLDALGLAIGARADAGLVRRGADQAAVTASFEIGENHPALALLRDQERGDLAERIAEEGLILRRTLNEAGRSRAFVNDEPVSVGLLRQVGDTLIEIHGQFETQGLLNAQTHRPLLDEFAGLAGEARACTGAWDAWRALEDRRRHMLAEIAETKAEETFLRQGLEDLQTLAPEEGEEEQLSEQRAFLMNREKLTAGVNAALEAISGDSGAQSRVGQAASALERLAGQAGELFTPLLEALDRAEAEIEEASVLVNHIAAQIEGGDEDLAKLEDRLFALRDMARRHRTEPDSLPALMAEFERRLNAIEDSSSALARLDQEIAQAREAYRDAAGALGAGRRKAAAAFDEQIGAELPPLKLDNARFETRITELDEADWGPGGQQQVGFHVATNPGADPEPLAKVASGGELARLMLAIKVTLARAAGPVSGAPTLIFDEVDSGISGSVADAVGERLAEIGQQVQVLVVTHSPQVAARAHRHWRVLKSIDGERAVTEIAELQAPDRREEIARMLSGASVTEQARAAADTLLAREAG